VEADRGILAAYAAIGILLALIFSAVSMAAEAAKPKGERLRAFLGLHRSRGIVLKISCLFAVDAFAGGFILQSFMAYWFTIRWGADAGQLGNVFFFANLF